MARKPYPTDLTDQQWWLIEPMMPRPKLGGRPRTIDLREVINGMFYLTRSGCAWRLIPHDLPNWNTIRHYFDRFKEDGTWRRIHDALRSQVRIAAGKTLTPSAVVIDSQSVKITAVKITDQKGRAVLMQPSEPRAVNAR
jgi:putative transposase